MSVSPNRRLQRAVRTVMQLVGIWVAVRMASWGTTAALKGLAHGGL